ncbi:MAG TPA: BrnT family toxin [Pyrinomonadaceae bacterium]|nr:BrnT family toxin [Pyrinomonadaceae bacterium]
MMRWGSSPWQRAVFPFPACPILKKHGVSFDEAVTVFNDPLAGIFDDEDYSAEERGEIIIGHSLLNRLVLVCFTERDENIVRIFSAQLATKRELGDYEEKANA